MLSRSDRTPGLFLIFSCVLVFSSCSYMNPFNSLFSSGVDDRFEENMASGQPAPPGDSGSPGLSFVVITDTHYYRSRELYMEKLEEYRKLRPFDFVVHLGDLTQAGQPFQFDFFLQDREALSVPVFCCLGNHDLFNGGFEPFFEKIGPSVFSFERDECLFIFLDTANGMLGEKQKAWYRDRLEETDMKNLFVFSHYSLVDSKTIDPILGFAYSEDLYWLLETNRSAGIDMFFSGHLHFYDAVRRGDISYVIVNNMADDDRSMVFVEVDGENIRWEPVSGVFR